MLTTINNYKVKRLLLNGHYLCSTTSDPSSTYLLCSTRSSSPSLKSLLNYRHLQFDCIIFPIETAIVGEGDHFDCFYVPEGYQLGLTRFREKRYELGEMVAMFARFCKELGEAVGESEVLGKEVEGYLEWDNMWVGQGKLAVVWYWEGRDGDRKGNSEEGRVVEKLVEILKMMYLSCKRKVTERGENNSDKEKQKQRQKHKKIIKSIISYDKSNNPLNIQSFTSFVSSLLSSSPSPSPIKVPRFLAANPNTRYSIDHTSPSPSLSKSLRFPKTYRKKTIDITSSTKPKNRYPKFSLFQNFKKHSPTNLHNKSNQKRSFSKDLTTLMGEQGDTIRVESGNLRISNLLRDRAIEAFEVEKKRSIDAGRWVPDKMELSGLKRKESKEKRRIKDSRKLNKSTHREESYLNRPTNETLRQYDSISSDVYNPSEKLISHYPSNLHDPLNSFKMKMMRFQKKKDVDDKLMRLFSSNRQPKINVYVELPERVSTMIENYESRERGLGQRSEGKFAVDEGGVSYTAPSEERLGRVGLKRNIFENNFVRGEEVMGREVDVGSQDREPSEIREMIQRLVDGPVVIRTVNSEVEFEREKGLDRRKGEESGSKRRKESKEEMENSDRRQKSEYQDNERIEKGRKYEKKNQQQVKEKLKEIQRQTQKYSQGSNSIQQQDKRQFIKHNRNLTQQFQTENPSTYFNINPTSFAQDPILKPLKSVRIAEPQPQSQQPFFTKQPHKTSLKIKTTHQPPSTSNTSNQQKINQFLEEQEIQEIILQTNNKKNNNNKEQNNNPKGQKIVKSKNTHKIKTGNQNQPKSIFQQRSSPIEKQQLPPNPKNQRYTSPKHQQLSTKQKQKSQLQSRLDTLKSSTKSKPTSSQLKRTNSMQINRSDQPSSLTKSTKISKIQSQIQSYIHFINLIGQTVSKSQKVCKSFTQIDWFTGVYFLYKRFYRQRKKIEEWLENGVDNFHRLSQPKLPKQDFQEWLKSEGRNMLLKKIRDLNGSIFESISKMNKTLAKKCINTRVLKAGGLGGVDQFESNIMVEYILVEYDELIEKEVGDEVRQHLVDLLDAAFIVAELDGKEIEYRVDMKRRREMLEGEVDVRQYFKKQQGTVDDLARAYNIQ